MTDNLVRASTAKRVPSGVTNLAVANRVTGGGCGRRPVTQLPVDACRGRAGIRKPIHHNVVEYFVVSQGITVVGAIVRRLKKFSVDPRRLSPRY